MKLRTYVLVFLTALAGSAFLASCLNEENKIPDNCYDGVLNNEENPEGFQLNGAPMFDCGGPNCVPCDHCANGVFEPWQDEEWRDCGGECEPCEQCNNGIKDADEFAVDCGGENCQPCEALCGDGLLNGYEIQIDCIDGTAVEGAGTCTACPTCDDDTFNGNEYGIDCGGPDCAPCCVTGDCGNGFQDVNEFNADCGGPTCPDCVNGISWTIDNEPYSTPTLLINVAWNDPLLTFANCPTFTGDEIPIQVGDISLLITGPFVYNGSLPQIFSFPGTDSNLDYAIVWTDELSNVYSSSQTGGSGQITLTRVKEVVVPDSDLDECNKPAGTYTYYRGTFSGVLSDGIDLSPTVDCNGSFQVTFFVP